MPRLRLGYTKSRGGCLRCKQRRVKCDENRPCKACARHGIECSLVSGHASREGSSTSTAETPAAQHRLSPDPDHIMKLSGSPSPTPTRIAQPMCTTPRIVESFEESNTPTESTTIPSDLSTSAHSLATSPLQTTPDPFPYFAKFTTETGPDEKENWASDLELLHHYTTYTYKAIAKGYSLEIWQITTPKIAFSNTFLLHEILAISAFHLAFLHPENEKKYTVQATHHQSRAIEGMREALENISAENCHALFSASTFLFVGSLAASQPKDPTQDFSLDNLVDVFLLLKGVRGIIDSAQELGLAHGPLKELFQPMSNVAPSPGLVRILAQLQNLLTRVADIVPASEDNQPAVIAREIERLVESIEYASHTAASPEYQTIAAWPLSISDSFIGLMRRRNQAALAVLSYYCVVMHSTEEDYWYTRGWGMSVIRDVAKALAPPWNQDAAWALGWMTGQVTVQ